LANTDLEVIIRIGSHSEKEYVEKTGHRFDGLMIGANLVEVTPGASASLLVRMAGQRKQRPYYFDPMTYAFGSYVDPISGLLRTDLDWIKSEQRVKGGKKGQVERLFKNSYAKLATALGEPFASSISNGGRAVTPDDLGTKAKRRATAASVIAYQRDRIRSVFREDEDYKEYADEVPEPAAIFAPYFYIEPSDEERWITVNLELAQAAAALKEPVELHTVICAPMETVSDRKFTDRIQAEVPASGVQGVWLWFSRFDEHAATAEELTNLRRLVSSLAGSGLKVYNLHGGYYSLALSKFGMTGVAHGVGYGEQKDVVPIIGQSTPTVRYYAPTLHARFGVPDIERSFSSLGISTPDDFWNTICDCAVCKGILQKGLDRFEEFGEKHYSTPQSKRMAQTPAAAKLCRFHFLLSRIRERDDLSKTSIAEVNEQLKLARRAWRGTVLRDDLLYIDRWLAALR
jgi:hypothetical protein